MKSRRHAASATLALSLLLHIVLLWYTSTQDQARRTPPTPPASVEILLKAPIPSPDPPQIQATAEVTEATPPTEPETPTPEPQVDHAPRDDGAQTAETQAVQTKKAPSSVDTRPPARIDPAPTPEPIHELEVAPAPEPLSRPEPAKFADLAQVQPDRTETISGATSAPPAPVGAELPQLEASSETMPENMPPRAINDDVVHEQLPDAFDGRLVPLDDQTLADAGLVSNAEGNSRNARIADEGFMVNLYLRRMTEQVYGAWQEWTRWQQRNRQRALSGTISFQVSLSGTLESARISKSSGDRQFDESALQALQRVKRFAVPEDPAVTARYYRRLRFHFSTESREIGAILKASASAG